jgi:hypothetical protein
MLTQLSLIPQLETLGIHFSLANGDDVDTASMAHVTLPNLRLFSFEGFSDYLENLLSRISAPVLSVLHLHIFSHVFIPVELPHLLQFMQTSENLVFNALELAFSGYSTSLLTGPHWEVWKRRFYLDFSAESALSILRPSRSGSKYGWMTPAGTPRTEPCITPPQVHRQNL